MYIIIDANVLGNFLGEPENEHCRPIYRWLKNGSKIIYSSGDQVDHEVRGFTKN